VSSLEHSGRESGAPGITVLLPVHNGRAHLVQALDSVLAQTLRHFTLLAIDDGSSDGSGEVLDSYAARDSRVTVLHKVNSGISDTLNLGLARAATPLVARMDADDVMRPERLARQAAFMAEHPELAFAGCYFDMIDGDGRVFRPCRPGPVNRRDLARMLARGVPITFTHPTVIYRREAVLAVGGYRRETEPCEDTDLFGRLITAGKLGLVQPESLMEYRVHGGSISARKVAIQFQMQCLVTANLYRRRRGLAELDLAAYRAAQGAAGWLARWHERRREWSAILLRQSLYDFADRRLLRCGLRITAAGLVRPATAAGRLIGRPPRPALRPELPQRAELPR
jgi:glycosyltransferase involved in cell wall biosynthesis